MPNRAPDNDDDAPAPMLPAEVVPPQEAGTTLARSPIEMDAKEFGAMLGAEKEKRALLVAYIKDHLVQDVDYGKITIGRGEKAVQTKDVLLKPGSEKIASLLHLRPTFEADKDVLKMLGQVGTGTVAVICRLVMESGKVVAEGRGACDGNTESDVNKRIKKACKRAQVDAVLRVAALSSHFTQDLEDEPPGGGMPPTPAAQPPRAPAPEARPAPAPKSAPPATPPAAQPPRAAAPKPAPKPAAPPPAPPKPAAGPDPDAAWLKAGHAVLEGGTLVVLGKEDGIPDGAVKRVCKDRDQNEGEVYGILNFDASEVPMGGPPGRGWALFEKTKVLEWKGATWGDLYRWAVKHRQERFAKNEPSNGFNDPFLYIIEYPGGACYTSPKTGLHVSTKPGEQCVALDYLVNLAVNQQAHAESEGAAPPAEEGPPPAPPGDLNLDDIPFSFLLAFLTMGATLLA